MLGNHKGGGWSSGSTSLPRFIPLPHPLFSTPSLYLSLPPGSACFIEDENRVPR